MTYDVLIIGGGVAGCSAAIQLAKRGHRVLLLEKQRYPAHKLCGEFLSVEVQAMFERLGVRDSVLEAGAYPIRRVAVTTPAGRAFEQALPGTALGLSRYTLDRLLFEQSQAAGADAWDGTAVQAVTGNLDDGFAVQAGGETLTARVVVGAYGKRSSLDRKLRRGFLKVRSPFVAFKAHFEGLDLPHVIELHAFPGGYCGLSHVENGWVNACWIAYERALTEAGDTADGMIRLVLRQNPMLARRFDALRRVSERFLAVSQVSFVMKGAFADDVCMMGDTAGMIAPMCGDGMAMALRGAELATPLVSSFLADGLTAPSFRRQYDQAWRREFGLRMRLGRWMHHAYCRPALAHVGIEACRRVPALGRWLISKTRGT